MNDMRNNPDYVYLGNNRYIEKNLYIKAMEDIKKYIPNKNFLGEADHPESENIKEDYNE